MDFQVCRRPKKKSFKSGQIYMKDAECAKMNEKSIFRYLFFELWSFLYSKYGKFSIYFHP